MEYRELKHTDLKVSRVAFGTMTFGKPVDARDALRMVDRCLEAGIQFFDTANMYQQGLAETMLGEALRGRRERAIVATKAAHRMGEAPDQCGLSRAAILRAIDESLRRLQTDYVDLYYLHWPDWQVPLEESLEAMQRLVEQGKVRYPATSNFASWQVTKALQFAREQKYKPAAVSQVMYNLLARGIEQEYTAMAREFGVSIVVYNPLAAGLLTGKYQPGAVPAGSRFDYYKLHFDRYWHERNFAAVEQLRRAAARAGRSLLSVALNWLLHHSPTDSVILGASRMEQLEQNLAAAEEGPLPEEVVAACDEVWRELRGPIPAYNR